MDGEKNITIEEAIYCMNSYLPGKTFRACSECPYHPANNEDSENWTCRSNEAHSLAIAALEILKRMHI